jgi:hypothetical protein
LTRRSKLACLYWANYMPLSLLKANSIIRAFSVMVGVIP